MELEPTATSTSPWDPPTEPDTQTCYPTRVLVADDDDDVRSALTAALADDGHEVIGLENGTQVIECLGIFSRDGLRPPDLLALDVRMPGPSGVDLLEALREAGWTTPVLVMSAYGSGAMRARVKWAGRAAFVEKPFSVDAICALARTMLRGAQGAP
jgi:DNA-binding response OmpR family regulator